MLARPVLAALALLLSITVIACSGDDDGTATPTSTGSAATGTPAAEEASPTPAPIDTPAPEPTDTPEPGDNDIGAPAIWQPTLGIQRMQEACPDKIDEECFAALADLERQDGASDEAIAFFVAHEVFLVAFEEHGAVDFGAVSSPLFNMGRPTPVFLNGDFSLLYLGELPPEDWLSRPTYEDLGDVLGWVEYSTLADATVSGETQVFTTQTPIQECRACQTLGYLNLEVTFVAGALQGAELLPMTGPPPTSGP